MADLTQYALPHLARGYRDRRHAGAELADLVEDRWWRDPLVLAVPRGGVIVAAEIARRLRCPLDVVVARKVGAPGHAELALGAVGADGSRVLNNEMFDALHVDPDYLEEAFNREAAEARSREERFRVGPKSDPIARTVVLVDDGVATGATLRACIALLQRRHPGSIVAAIPVGSPEVCQRIARDVDELVCPLQPEPFLAVGHHYESFPQVGDSEVRRVLEEHQAWLAQCGRQTENRN